MSGIISMINMLRNLGWIDGFMPLWFHNWMISWAIAFPIVVTLLPFVRKFTGLLVDMSGPQAPKWSCLSTLPRGSSVLKEQVEA